MNANEKAVALSLRRDVVQHINNQMLLRCFEADWQRLPSWRERADLCIGYLPDVPPEHRKS